VSGDSPIYFTSAEKGKGEGERRKEINLSVSVPDFSWFLVSTFPFIPSKFLVRGWGKCKGKCKGLEKGGFWNFLLDPDSTDPHMLPSEFISPTQPIKTPRLAAPSKTQTFPRLEIGEIQYIPTTPHTAENQHMRPTQTWSQSVQAGRQAGRVEGEREGKTQSNAPQDTEPGQSREKGEGESERQTRLTRHKTKEIKISPLPLPPGMRNEIPAGETESPCPPPIRPLPWTWT